MRAADDLRKLYVEQYSEEKVKAAIRSAGRQRFRCQALGRLQHFTAWDWLDLCAQSNFRCPICGAALPLSPHHRIPLYHGGTNTIDNIEPICRKCHMQLHVRIREEEPSKGHSDVADAWFDEQQAVFQKFEVGDKVRTSAGNATIDCRRHGIIVELVPPSRGAGPLWAIHSHDGHRAIELRRFGQEFKVGKARVRWNTSKQSFQETIELLENLKKVKNIVRSEAAEGKVSDKKPPPLHD